MGELVEINISTDNEVYPVLGIREAEDGAGGYAIPRTLVDALEAARDAVDALEVAIMEHVAERYPEAEDIAAWLTKRADGLALEEARAAYEAEHPDGWRALSSEERWRLIDAARS